MNFAPLFLNHEKVVLYRKMLCGGNFRYTFRDSRHRVIFDHLDYLQKQVFTPGTMLFLRYLRDCGALDAAGGEGYIMSIFHGLEPEDAL